MDVRIDKSFGFGLVMGVLLTMALAAGNIVFSFVERTRQPTHQQQIHYHYSVPMPAVPLPSVQMPVYPTPPSLHDLYGDYRCEWGGCPPSNRTITLPTIRVQ